MKDQCLSRQVFIFVTVKTRIQLILELTKVSSFDNNIFVHFALPYPFLLQVVGVDQKDTLEFVDLGFADDKISAR